MTLQTTCSPNTPGPHKATELTPTEDRRIFEMVQSDCRMEDIEARYGVANTVIHKAIARHLRERGRA